VALPEFERFKSRNPLQMALSFDADGPYAEHFLGKPIRATPLYVLRGEDSGVTHEGVMKAEQLEKWVRDAQGAMR
jgi:hypothetical protein